MVSYFSIFVVFLALSVEFCMCFENVCLESNANPDIFMSLFIESVVLLIVSFNLVECSAECSE